MDELRINPMKALCTVRDFKGHIRNLKGYSKAEISVFPADPAELPEDALRRAYGHQMPVQCQVDEMAVKFLRSVLPARDTHSSIRGMCGKPSLQQFQGNSGGMDNTLMQLKALLDQSGQAENMPLTLTMLPPKRNKKLLALEMGSVEAPACFASPAACRERSSWKPRRACRRSNAYRQSTEGRETKGAQQRRGRDGK